MHTLTKRLRRGLKRLAALLLILAGLITFPLPIPIGAILISIGLALLITSSRALTLWIRVRRGQQPQLNEKLQWMETRLPRFLARAIRKTSPDYGRKVTPARAKENA